MLMIPSHTIRLPSRYLLGSIHKQPRLDRSFSSSTPPRSSSSIVWQAGTLAVVGGVFYVASNYFSGDAWRYNQDGSQKDEPVAPQALVTSKVYFDVAIDKKPAGRVIIGLHGHVVARTVDNFERICRGDEQIGNVKLTYEGSTMHRIIPGFMIQGGERPGRSVYKSIHFDDENFQLKHTGPGVLSMANAGKDTNTSQFFITTVRTPHLDGKHTVFGTVLDGWNVVRAMEACGTSSGKPMRDVVVTKCGVLEEEPENK